MKVVQIIDELNTGGAERVFIDLTNLLYKSKKIDLSVLTFNNNGSLHPLLNKKITKISFIRKSKFNLFEAYQLSKILKQYDIVHVHMRQVYRYIRVVCLLFNVQTKIVFHDHYGKISTDKSIPRFFNSILKPKYYIGVSEELTSWAINKLKVRKVFKLSNIVVKESGIESVEKKEGFIIVGNIKPVKNQLFAIRLAAELDKKITIVGKIHDEKYYTTLVKEVNKLGIQNNVKFLHNIINVQKMLPRFELGLMTSISESGPLVLIEYLYQNLPFIAYETGEVAETIKNDLPFFLINNFDINLWLKKIEEIKKIDNSIILKTYKEYFNPDDYINKCIDIYKEILYANILNLKTDKD
jgi:glycosyltransferase involved in cell wall biosynthesis